MLEPRKIKYRKVQKGPPGRVRRARLQSLLRRLRIEVHGTGLRDRAPDRGRPNRADPLPQTARQGWIRVFPDKTITKKPAEVRMGKGKGPLHAWVAVVKPGKLLFEMEGVSREDAQEAFRLASRKLSLPTVFVER